jgi:hypothetical protein
MKIKNKFNFILIIMIFTILLLTGNVQAYYGQKIIASGKVQVLFGMPQATIEKREESNTQYFKVTNTGNSECFVRIKVFGIGLEDSMIILDGNWERKDDGYIYYKNPLNPGNSTTEISINKNLTIICIGEYCNALYSESGNAECNWDYTLEI